MRQKALFILSVILLVACTWACGTPVSDESTVIETILGETQYEDMYCSSVSIDYVVPSFYPNIYVSQGGYETYEDKKVVFSGIEAGTEYSIVNAITGESVMTLETTGSRMEGSSWGDFTELSTPGLYYVDAGSIGISYSFEINDDVYVDELDLLVSAVMEADILEDPVMCSGGVINLLMAYEMNPQLFKNDEDGEWFLSWIAEGLESALTEDYGSDFSSDEKLCLATALSKFSGIYRNVDASVSGLFLEKSESLYADISEDTTAEYLYMAAAQLYRVTGKNIYETVAEDYLRDTEKTVNSWPIDPVFVGGYAYMTTPRVSERNLCFPIMTAMMEQSTEYSDITTGSVFFACSRDPFNDDIKTECMQILENMRMMAYTNYVITNSEYRVAIHNNYHFISGLNPKGYVLTEDLEEWDSAEAFYARSLLIVVLSQIDNTYDGSY